VVETVDAVVTLDSADVAELVETSLPMVRRVVACLAAHYPRHCDRDDLVAAGTLGLVEAAQRFDPSRGVPFESWAALRVRGAVVDAVRALDFAPRALRASARDLAAVREALEAELGRHPSLEQVAERMGISTDELVHLEGRVHRSIVLRLDAPARDQDGDATLAKIVLDPHDSPLEALERRERESYLRDALALLPTRMRIVLAGYFLEGRSSADLAQELGVTESRVSQLRTEALSMVRHGMAAQYGEPAVDLPARAAARQRTYNASLAERSRFGARLSAQLPRPRTAQDVVAC